MYETIMEQLTPWLAGIGGVTGAGTIIYFIVRLILGRVIKKNDALLKENYNAEKVSQAVADKLAGKTLDVDITAITEAKLNKIAKELDTRVDDVEAAFNSLKLILISIAKGVARYKSLTNEEKAEITAAIQQLEKSYTPPDADDKIAVVLKPVELPEEDAPAPTPSGGVNFGDLEG